MDDPITLRDVLRGLIGAGMVLGMLYSKSWRGWAFFAAVGALLLWLV